jgi:hypothetical protein
MKAPNTKHQTPKKSQYPNPNFSSDLGTLELGLWSLSGVWSLVFGVWNSVFGAWCLDVSAGRLGGETL